MRSKPIRRVVIGVLGALALWLAPHAHAQCHYEVTVITGPSCGALGPATLHFLGINEHGQTCGEMEICDQVGAARPIVWTPEQGLIILPLPEGATRGVANDINDVLGSDGFGQVACTLVFPGQGNRASLYNDGVWTVLEPEGDGSHTEAFAINDGGWIAGYRDTDSGRLAIRWSGEQVLSVSSPIGGTAVAHDINASFDATGGFGALTSGGRAFLWDVSAVLIPPVPMTNSSEGHGVNDRGLVTGWSRPNPQGGPLPLHSWVWSAGEPVDLGDFAGNIRTLANAINNADQVVGYSFNGTGGNEIPFLWQDGSLANLRDMIEMPPGTGVFASANAINNRGQVAGNTSARGVILTPVSLLGDVNLDCEVNGDDLAIVLSDWGPDKFGHIADIVTNSTFQPPGDGVVDGADLAVVLGNWTKRPSNPSRRN